MWESEGAMWWSRWAERRTALWEKSTIPRPFMVCFYLVSIFYFDSFILSFYLHQSIRSSLLWTAAVLVRCGFYWFLHPVLLYTQHICFWAPGSKKLGNWVICWMVDGLNFNQMLCQDGEIEWEALKCLLVRHVMENMEKPVCWKRYKNSINSRQMLRRNIHPVGSIWMHKRFLQKNPVTLLGGFILCENISEQPLMQPARGLSVVFLGWKGLETPFNGPCCETMQPVVQSSS